MTKKEPKDLGASVRQRLLNRARERGEDFQLVLINYAIERFLYRLSKSKHRDRLVLKGAMLFSVWEEAPHRPTRDLDLLGSGDDAVPTVEGVVVDVLRSQVGSDGIEFDEASIRGEEIREGQEHHGVRVRLEARLAGARIPVQVDVAFGDVVIPQPEIIEYPTLLDLPSPRIRAYSPAPVIAEKFQAIVALGIANTRMKDFYDLWVLADRLEFDGAILREAIHATFERRKTPIPTEPPVALTAEFHDDAAKQAQWGAFLRRTGLEAPALPEVAAASWPFLAPVAEAARLDVTFQRIWRPGGPWRSL